LRHPDNLIAINRTAHTFKPGTTSCDNRDSNHHHCQPDMAGHDRGERAGGYFSKLV
jgi:hypothetical protein